MWVFHRMIFKLKGNYFPNKGRKSTMKIDRLIFLFQYKPTNLISLGPIPHSLKFFTVEIIKLKWYFIVHTILTRYILKFQRVKGTCTTIFPS